MKSLQVECQTEKVESYENFESTKLATMADTHGETPDNSCRHHSKKIQQKCKC